MNIKSINNIADEVIKILGWLGIISTLWCVYTLRDIPGFFQCFMFSAIYGPLIAIRFSQKIFDEEREAADIPMFGAVLLCILYVAVHQYGKNGFLIAALTLAGSFGIAWLACRGLRNKQKNSVPDAVK